MNNLPTVDFESIQPGDSVCLRWLGDRALNKLHNYAWAEVIRRNRAGNLVVDCSFETGTRTVHAGHIYDHKPREATQ